MGWLKRWLLAACLSPFRLFTQVIYFIPQCKQRSAVVFFLTTVYLSQNAVTSGEVLPTKTDYTTDVKFSSHNVLFLPAHQILILRAGWMILCRNRVNSIGALIGTGSQRGRFLSPHVRRTRRMTKRPVLVKVALNGVDDQKKLSRTAGKTGMRWRPVDSISPGHLWST